MTGLRIAGGRVIDPANGVDRVTDLWVADGRVAALGAAPPGFETARTLDAAGRIVCPGLVDLSARLREPGQEHKGTIDSESAAAAAGGITTLCCPPDTDPVVDTPAVVELIHQRAAQAGRTRVEVLGALTRELAGEHLAEMGALKLAGCVGVSNAARPVVDTEVMRRALEYAATFGQTVFLDAEDPWLARGRYIHDGDVSTRLGLPGIPATAETIAVARDLLLVELTGARAHFRHLSTARAVQMMREARARGLPVSADVAVHHLHLTDADTDGFNAECHVRPPLRGAEDRAALRAAVADGTLVAVCSDHQPHERDARENPFTATAPGISGLETLLPLCLQLVDDGLLSLSDALARLTSGPAAVLGLDRGSLTPGAPADLCLIDPQARWRLDASRMLSRGRNTPFGGWEMHGRVTHTLLGGRVVHGPD